MLNFIRKNVDLVRSRRSNHLLALIDQSIYAIANFSVGIFIAAAAGVAALGEYAIVSSIATLSLGILVTLVLDPLTVFGAHSAARRFRLACAKAAAIGAVSLGAGGALLWMYSLYWRLPKLGILALGLMLCAAQSAVLARKRILYVTGHIWPSVAISATYGATVVVVVGTGAAFGKVSAGTGVMAIVLGSLCASGAWAIRCLRLPISAATEYARHKGVLRYVGGGLATSFSGSLALQGIYWVGALTAGVGVIGQVKLVEQIVLPYSQLLIMLSLPDQVQSAKEYALSRGVLVVERMKRRTRHFTIGAAFYGLVAFGVAMVWQSIGNAHGSLAIAILAYSLCLIIQSAAYPRLTALRAYRKPWIITGSYMGMGLSVIVGGLLLRPSTALQLVGLLVIAWTVELLILQFATRTLQA